MWGQVSIPRRGLKGSLARVRVFDGGAGEPTCGRGGEVSEWVIGEELGGVVHCGGGDVGEGAGERLVVSSRRR